MREALRYAYARQEPALLDEIHREKPVWRVRGIAKWKHLPP